MRATEAKSDRSIHQRIDKDNQPAGEINLYPFGFPKSERIEYEHLQMRQLPILFLDECLIICQSIANLPFWDYKMNEIR